MTGKMERYRRQMIIREAEGYLELELPHYALRSLSQLTLVEMGGHGAYLQGEALRSLERYDEAIPFLKHAADQSPSELAIWVALGWCYKRTDSLGLAIEALEEALDVSPDNALVLYNLACYYSLAKDRAQCIRYLKRAIDKDPRYREQIASETDFDPVRNDPEFREFTAPKSGKVSN